MVAFQWSASTDNVGVVGYRVERCQGQGCANFALVGTTTYSGFVNQALTEGTSYSYRVQAFDSAGNLSTYSNAASINTGFAPSAPGSPSASAVTGSRIDLTWGPATDDQGIYAYYVERCQGSGCSNFAYIAGVYSGASYSNTGLTSTTTYRYRVRASDANGNLGPYSDVATATTLTADTTPPTAPTQLTATVPNLGGGSRVDLAWGASTDESGVSNYLIERCEGAGCTTFVEIYSLPGHILQYSNAWLSPATSYTYRVRAKDSAGNTGGYSNLATVTTQIAPTAPENFTATAVNSGRIDLSWSPASDDGSISLYYIERCQGIGCSNFLGYAFPNSSATSYSDTGVQPETSYSYRIKARDDQFNLGAYSSVANATTPTVDATVPTVPTGVAATAVSASQIDVSWAASTDNVGVTEYRVERCEGAGCNNFVQVATTTGTTHTSTSLAAATSYSYRVAAVDAAGNMSAYSAVATASTLGAPQAQLFFIHTDHLNTPRLVADATGTTVWRWDQAEPFGNNPADEDPDANSVAFDLPVRLPGQYFDKETALHYNYFRDYDPSIGIYKQSDLIGLYGGLNTYAYAGGDPIYVRDPSGLVLECKEVFAGYTTRTERVKVKEEVSGWVRICRPTALGGAPGIPDPVDRSRREGGRGGFPGDVQWDVVCRNEWKVIQPAVWEIRTTILARYYTRCVDNEACPPKSYILGGRYEPVDLSRP